MPQRSCPKTPLGSLLLGDPDMCRLLLRQYLFEGGGELKRAAVLAGVNLEFFCECVTTMGMREESRRMRAAFKRRFKLPGIHGKEKPKYQGSPATPAT